MPTAFCAAHFGAHHAECRVFNQFDGVGAHRFVKARPSASGIELCARLEQLVATALARVESGAMLVEQLARPRALGRGLAQHRKRLVVKLFAPLVVGLLYSLLALGMTFIAWIITFSTGTYPKWAGKFVFGTIRFWNRVNGYAFLLVSDKYPSFAL